MTLSFKERYDNDEEFRKKHKAYLGEKVECECGKTVTRGSMTSHHKTQVHIKGIATKQKKTVTIPYDEYTRLLKKANKKNIKTS